MPVQSKKENCTLYGVEHHEQQQRTLLALQPASIPNVNSVLCHVLCCEDTLESTGL